MNGKIKRFLPLAVAMSLIAAVGILMMPVCTPITAEQLSFFNSPIEQRTDTDFGMKIFRQRQGQWFQCKTRFSRLGFS